MTTASTTGDSVKNRRPESDLDRRYGRIAISAVVAALPYRGETRNEAATPAQSHEDRAA
jgi:hypothetical protein